jgi:hypothetical protein
MNKEMAKKKKKKSDNENKGKNFRILSKGRFNLLSKV